MNPDLRGKGRVFLTPEKFFLCVFAYFDVFGCVLRAFLGRREVCFGVRTVCFICVGVYFGVSSEQWLVAGCRCLGSRPEIGWYFQKRKLRYQ
jgi:hypothetical protein